MATWVNSSEKDSAKQIRVVVLGEQDSAYLRAELEQAGYKQFDPDKVFERKDWVVFDTQSHGDGHLIVMRPREPGPAGVAGLVRNLAALAVARRLERKPPV